MKYAGLIIAFVLIGAVTAEAISNYFYPKINYQIGESLTVAYTTVPLEFGCLLTNTSYTYLEYNETATPALQVKDAGNVTINFSSVNATHFTEFTVEVWNLTATPNAKVGSFNLTNTPLFFITGIANYGYSFDFTTANVTSTGTVTLEVHFQGQS